VSLTTPTSEEDAFVGGTLLTRMLRIAVPLTLSSGVRYAVDLSNMYWIGKLGVASLSVVTALGTFLSLTKMFAGFTSAGTSAVVGRMVGEDRRREALRVAQKVTAVTVVLGLAVALLGAAVSQPALTTLQFRGALRVEAQRYLFVLLGGLPLSFGMMSMNGVLIGLGRPRASVVASTTSLLVAFVMTPLLVRVLHAGVWGAAFAQVAGDACGYTVGLRALGSQARRYGSLPWARRFTKLRELWPVVRVGTPLTLDAVIHGTVWFALIAFLSRYGSEYVAAQGTEERFVQILNMPTDGIAPAAATLVGYELGRENRKEALRAVWTALGLVVLVAVCGILLLSVSPAPVVAWLCADEGYVDVGARVLSVAALGLAFLGGRDVLEAAFGGVGNTVPPVVVGLAIALSRFPLAYLLAVRVGLGGLGVTWAVNTTLIVQTLLLLGWFRLRFHKYTSQPIEDVAFSVRPPPPSDGEPTLSPNLTGTQESTG
jgi:putative MATE family efflux protein